MSCDHEITADGGCPGDPTRMMRMCAACGLILNVWEPASSDMATVQSIDFVLKDMYPRPGENLKQWVVDEERERKWERNACPDITGIVKHKDDEDMTCMSIHEEKWIDLDDRECRICNYLHQQALNTPTVQAFLKAKAELPPICKDRAKLSTQVMRDMSLESHPLFAMLPRGVRP